MKIATKDLWNIKAISNQTKEYKINKSFNLEEFNLMTLGFIPESMEDKWFIYYDNNQLFFHRSWTGVCIYIVDFTLVNQLVNINKVIINSDPDEYIIDIDLKKEIDILFKIIDSHFYKGKA